jgi:K+-transporting ATPase c subunit
MRSPTEVRRDGVAIATIENEVPTEIDAASFSDTSGNITVKAAGRQHIRFVDQANVSGNRVYSIIRSWPTFTRARQVICTEFRK